MNWQWLSLTLAAVVIGILFRRILWDKIVEPFFTQLPKWLVKAFKNLRDRGFRKSTYFSYRSMHTPLLDTVELIQHLEDRYHCKAFLLGGRPFPVTVVWKNIEQQINPDSILGTLDKKSPDPLPSFFRFDQKKYARARLFIKRMLEAGPIKYEGCDYCMTKIDLSDTVPKIHGTLGLYYDCILTQYAMEWELTKALMKKKDDAISSLIRKGTLPLREFIEAKNNPILDGTTRTTALAISTLLVFKRKDQGFYCLLCRRSADVAVSPNTMHVVPAGMFEAMNLTDSWSIEMNVWRELLEELYGQKELEGTGEHYLNDFFRNQSPIRSLLQMLKAGSAVHSAVGICCDLLTLRPEICTVLFVADPAFAEERKMQLNWEYAHEIGIGKGAIPWANIDDAIQKSVKEFGFSATGTVTLGLGREWVRVHYGM